MASRGEGLKKIKINMEPVKDMKLSEVFGTESIPVTEMIKKLWILIKEKDLRIKEK